MINSFSLLLFFLYSVIGFQTDPYSCRNLVRSKIIATDKRTMREKCKSISILVTEKMLSLF